jgi:DNA-binding transcriptional MerR regulator
LILTLRQVRSCGVEVPVVHWYRVRAFAALAGVSVRTLQHYDRLGLMAPARTETRHRLYSQADLARVRHITALKSLGLSLKQIKDALGKSGPPLAQLLRAQIAVLEAGRARIDRALDVIRRVQGDAGDDGTPLLERVVAAIESQDVVDGMRQYYSDVAWAVLQPQFADWPPPHWRDFYRDVEAALDVSPDSDRAEALLARSFVLWHADTHGDRAIELAVTTGWRKAWDARDRWPQPLHERFARFKCDEIAGFLGRTAMSVMRRKGTWHFASMRP